LHCHHTDDVFGVLLLWILAHHVRQYEERDGPRGGGTLQITGLKNAPYLNGKRGVVEREDPRPSARGRWEVELRLDGGRLEIKSLKMENIETVHKLDKTACKVWAAEEKKHKEMRRQKEEKQEEIQYRKCVEKKIEEMPNLAQSTRSLLNDLEPKEALTLIDKAASEARGGNIDMWISDEARKLLESGLNGPPTKRHKL